MLFDERQFDLKCYVQELKSRIDKRANFLLGMIDKWQRIYHNKVVKYSGICDAMLQNITTQYQSIDQQLQILLKFVFSLQKKTSIF